jgi:hypothetical protein
VNRDLLTLGLCTQRARDREAAHDGDDRIFFVAERVPSRSRNSLPAQEVHPKYAVISLSRRRRLVHSDWKD